jgi:hypothetical protein
MLTLDEAGFVTQSFAYGSGTAGRLVEPGALRRDSGKAPPPSGRLFRFCMFAIAMTASVKVFDDLSTLANGKRLKPIQSGPKGQLRPQSGTLVVGAAWAEGQI